MFAGDPVKINSYWPAGRIDRKGRTIDRIGLDQLTICSKEIDLIKLVCIRIQPQGAAHVDHGRLQYRRFGCVDIDPDSG